MRTPDALTWLVAAVLLTRVRLKARVRSATEEPSMLRDLREGWGVFTGQTWLWVVVAGFGSPGCSAFCCSGCRCWPSDSSRTSPP